MMPMLHRMECLLKFSLNVAEKYLACIWLQNSFHVTLFFPRRSAKSIVSLWVVQFKGNCDLLLVPYAEASRPSKPFWLGFQGAFSHQVNGFFIRNHSVARHLMHKIVVYPQKQTGDSRTLCSTHWFHLRSMSCNTGRRENVIFWWFATAIPLHSLARLVVCSFPESSDGSRRMKLQLIATWMFEVRFPIILWSKSLLQEAIAWGCSTLHIWFHILQHLRKLEDIAYI